MPFLGCIVLHGSAKDWIAEDCYVRTLNQLIPSMLVFDKFHICKTRFRPRTLTLTTKKGVKCL